MPEIHPSAIVHPDVVLGEGTEVGPFAILDRDVRVGSNCKIGANAIIRSHVALGNDCVVDSFAVIGGAPQHLKYSGEPTRVEIGDRVILREYVTVNRGTEEGGGVTRVADNCFIMAYTHVGHDCSVGEGVIIANAVQLAGHVTIGEKTVIGGHSAVVQFCRIGMHGYIGGGTLVRKDFPPYLAGKGTEIEIQGVNSVGLARRGFAKESIRAIKDVYRLFYLQNLTVSKALELAREFEAFSEARHFIDFVRTSKVGIIR